MTEFHKPYPLFYIPLTDEEKRLIGEIVAIQGQIEFLLGDIVQSVTGVDHDAKLAIMHSASLKINTYIFVTVIRAKIKDENVRASAEYIFKKMESLAKGRNDFIHALYASTDEQGEYSLIPGLFIPPINKPVAIKTGNFSKRSVGDLLSVRDEAALISQELGMVHILLRHPFQPVQGPPDASPDKPAPEPHPNSPTD